MVKSGSGSSHTRISEAFIFPNMVRTNIRSHAQTCFAIPNHIMHRHEQTHLSVHTHFISSNHFNTSASSDIIRGYVPLGPYLSSSCHNGRLLYLIFQHVHAARLKHNTFRTAHEWNPLKLSTVRHLCIFLWMLFELA